MSGYNSFLDQLVNELNSSRHYRRDRLMNGSIALDYARNRLGVSDRRAQEERKVTRWAAQLQR